ncbi:MAG: restriction endonuclease subunit S [Saprospiraceae bacterium]|nr:restriction endonuclease subunit S [Saprospiraceae bacterium]
MMKLEKLGAITKNLDSRRIPLNSEERIAKSKQGLYPYIGANNIVGYIDEYIFDEKILCVAEDGGSWGANQQCAVIYEGKTWVNNHAHVLAENGKASLEFIKNYLNYANLNKYIKGATRGKLNKSVLEKIPIPYPPLPDQLHIANLLSKAENLIPHRKESIRLLDEFLKSTFLEMFGNLKGERVPLSTACIINPKKSEINSLDRNSEVSFVPMAFVSEKGDVDLVQTRRLEDVWNGFTYFRENDVVFAKITPCMENGKGAIMKNLKNGIGFGTTEFHVLRPIEGISTSEWIYHLTMQHSFRKKAEQNMSGSAGQKRVPTDYFDKVKIVIPPIQLQTQFAQIVEKTEGLKTQYQQSLQELEHLYGSLSQKAFRGELLSGL